MPSDGTSQCRRPAIRSRTPSIAMMRSVSCTRGLLSEATAVHVPAPASTTTAAPAASSRRGLRSSPRRWGSRRSMRQRYGASLRVRKGRARLRCELDDPASGRLRLQRLRLDRDRPYAARSARLVRRRGAAGRGPGGHRPWGTSVQPLALRWVMVRSRSVRHGVSGVNPPRARWMMRHGARGEPRVG
jgi:hypothetical protein